MLQPVKKQKAYRKDFYSIFESMVGRQMTEMEHAFIKALLLNYLHDHEENASKKKEQPRLHTFVCSTCRKIKVGEGHDFLNSMVKEYEVIKDNDPRI